MARRGQAYRQRDTERRRPSIVGHTRVMSHDASSSLPLRLQLSCAFEKPENNREGMTFKWKQPTIWAATLKLPIDATLGAWLRPFPRQEQKSTQKNPSAS